MPATMLSLRLAPTRVGRGITTSILQTQTRKFYSTKPRSATSAFIINKTIKYTIIASSTAIACGIWYLATEYNKVPDLSIPPLTASLPTAPGPSKDQVTRILSQGAYSLPVRKVAGVSRYDGAQLASNSPCEDRFIHGTFPSPRNDGGRWMAWAVFDGHAGWQTADLLEKQLLPSVRDGLGQVMPASLFKEDSEAVEAVQRAVVKAFVDLDDSIIQTALATTQSKEPLQDKVKKLTTGYAGSCALLSLYDPVTSTVHVACTGDSRAVLGQKRPDGTWEAIPLSVDQTGSNEDEVARLKREHPGEEKIVDGPEKRILGLMVSRAFGDGRWKWPLELQADLKQRFYGPSLLSLRYPLETPPYLTAEPAMTATKIDPSKPSFLIMATDGMWDCLSNQQAVDLVGKWLDSDKAERRRNRGELTDYEPFDFGQFRKGVDWRFVEGRTTVQDDNAAVHLMRNSLGGNHHELIASRLAYGSPFSRNVRDDITVQVVFFANKGTA